MTVDSPIKAHHATFADKNGNFQADPGEDRRAWEVAATAVKKDARVFVNGKVELDASGSGPGSGPVSESPEVRDYGAGKGVQGRIFSIGGDPRLIVLDGRHLEYDPGHVVVSGKRLIEAYIAETPRYLMPPRKLGAHEYFMMGDNRNNSNDSHAWGSLTRDRFIGRAEILFWPLNRFRLFSPWLLLVMLGLFAGYQLLYADYLGVGEDLDHLFANAGSESDCYVDPDLWLEIGIKEDAF